MAARSIASLSIHFGLVSIPVKVYAATESKSAVSFNLLHRCGSRLRQQYVCQQEGVVVERADMVKGYEFEKDKYVVFTPEELKALEDTPQPTIDIVAFVPEAAVDPIYYDKPYYLGPDKRGAKPYSLLAQALRTTGKCALAKWAWKGKQYMVQLRAGEDGLILQQLLYADEVRAMADLHVDTVEVSGAELALAQQLVEQYAVADYDPAAYQDEEKQRVLAQIERKIAGQQITVASTHEAPTGTEVIDLMEALRQSIARPSADKAKARTNTASQPPARRTAKRSEAERAAAAPTRRAGKKQA